MLSAMIGKEVSEEEVLWRYMDFTKFMAMLKSSAVHFAKVGSFNDPWEVAAPRHMVVRPIDEYSLHSTPESQRDWFVQAREVGRRHVRATCWHRNASESAAMWSAYVKSGEGIAINTTVRQLLAPLGTSRTSFLYGGVRYEDFETYDDPLLAGYFSLAMLKRKCFEHEQEYRVVTTGSPPDNGTDTMHVPVDLGAMINEVVVAPTSEPWVYDLVRTVTHDAGLPTDIVRRSALLVEPDHLLPGG